MSASNPGTAADQQAIDAVVDQALRAALKTFGPARDDERASRSVASVEVRRLRMPSARTRTDGSSRRRPRAAAPFHAIR